MQLRKGYLCCVHFSCLSIAVPGWQASYKVISVSSSWPWSYGQHRSLGQLYQSFSPQLQGSVPLSTNSSHSSPSTSLFLTPSCSVLLKSLLFDLFCRRRRANLIKERQARRGLHLFAGALKPPGGGGVGSPSWKSLVGAGRQLWKKYSQAQSHSNLWSMLRTNSCLFHHFYLQTVFHTDLVSASYFLVWTRIRSVLGVGKETAYSFAWFISDLDIHKDSWKKVPELPQSNVGSSLAWQLPSRGWGFWQPSQAWSMV